MTGYFSRLIQQTGITVGTGELASISDVVRSQELGALERDELLTTTLESDKSLTTNEEKGNDKGEMTNMELNSLSFPIPPTQNFSDLNAMRSAGEAIASNHEQSDLAEAMLAREVERSNPFVRKEQPEIVESNIEFLSEKNSELTDNITSEKFANLPKKLEGEKNVLNQMPVVIKIPKSPIISAKELPGVRSEVQLPEPYNGQPPAIPQDSNSFLTHQVNLQTVREWVSKTPEENLTAQLQIPDRPSPITNYPSLITHHQLPINPPEKTPNFTLSIGTISLTLEAPKPEIKQPQPPPKPTNRTVQPVSQTSRMNRHYIRLR